MNTPSGIALSGMRAAQTPLDVAAFNVANLATDGFRRQIVEAADTASGGVAVTARFLGYPGDALERDLVGQLQAKNAFLANVAVFRTADQMVGALLDLRA